MEGARLRSSNGQGSGDRNINSKKNNDLLQGLALLSKASPYLIYMTIIYNTKSINLSKFEMVFLIRREYEFN